MEFDGFKMTETQQPLYKSIHSSHGMLVGSISENYPVKTILA